MAEAIQVQAGHASIESTRIYLHLVNDWVSGEHLAADAAIQAQTVAAVSVPSPLSSDAATSSSAVPWR